MVTVIMGTIFVQFAVYKKMRQHSARKRMELRQLDESAMNARLTTCNFQKGKMEFNTYCYTRCVNEGKTRSGKFSSDIVLNWPRMLPGIPFQI